MKNIMLNYNFFTHPLFSLGSTCKRDTKNSNLIFLNWEEKLANFNDFSLESAAKV